MTATSRWVRYPVAGTTEVSTALVGQRGFSRGTDNVGDTFTISSANNNIRVNCDGVGAQQITLTSGTSLDPRFVAKDIQRKVQAFGSSGNGFKWFTGEFSNLLSSDGESHFIFKSGTSGASSTVAITDGDNNGRSTLGLSTVSEVAGDIKHTDYTRSLSTGNSAYGGTVTVTGTYGGLLDEEYHVVCTNAAMSVLTPGGGNTYAGTASVSGDYNHDTACSYTVTIDASGGNEVMNAGSGSVPTFTVNDTGGLNDDVATGQELLFSDYYYYVGSFGVRVKYTDAQFGNGDTFTIVCTPAAGGGGSVGAATIRYYSDRGDDASANVTSQLTPVDIGTKNVSMSWTAGTLAVKDAWRVLCKSPTPEAYGVTSMSYGNVTVTTNSPVKVHQFEIVSGAKVLSNVKFSLQSDGTFSHHDAGDGDTEFHFGTAGPDNRGEGSGPVADAGVEWTADTAATDISQDKVGGNTGAPTFLWSSKDDLAVVADADNAETVGNTDLTSDAIFTAIQLGANETGANSSIVYRCYFDYS